MNLDDFAAVKLDEVLETAGLLKRVDRKYLLTDTAMSPLLQYLAAECAVLEIDRRRSFTYQSVYFDDAERSSYLGAARKLRRRFKVRTRTYCDSGLCMVEVKVRGARGNTVKTRQLHSQNPYGLLGSEQFVDEQLDGRALARRLQPTLANTYVRSTLTHLGAGSRITIDRDLQARLVGTLQSVSFPRTYVVETKSLGERTIADEWLWAHGIRPAKVSKYATSFAMMDPTLPANRWSRTIRDLMPTATFGHDLSLDPGDIDRQVNAFARQMEVRGLSPLLGD